MRLETPLPTWSYNKHGQPSFGLFVSIKVGLIFENESFEWPPVMEDGIELILF